MSFFIEPFLGVLAAFGWGRLWDWIKDSRNKGKLKENLRNELEKCMNLLTGEGKLLPTMMWNSTVTSSDVKLLSFDERTNLSSVYFDIENHNYEAKTVRDSAVIAQTGSRDSTRGGKKASIWHWERLSKALIEDEKVLKQQISGLLKEPWWK